VLDVGTDTGSGAHFQSPLVRIAPCFVGPGNAESFGAKMAGHRLFDGPDPTVNHELWWLETCKTEISRLVFWIWISAVVLMCFHQILQRPGRLEVAAS
jgi:hypothetical protein